MRRRSPVAVPLALAALALALAGCLAPEVEPAAVAPVEAVALPFAAGSAAFGDGEAVPLRHTCYGDDVSPPLAITGVPAGASHLALLMGDPDAPYAPAASLTQRNITHWLVWNVPVVGGMAAFEEGAVPEGAVQGANARGRNDYAGPCPPVPGDPHRYVFRVLALDGPLALAEGATRAELERALEGRVVAEAGFHGVFARPLPAGAR